MPKAEVPVVHELLDVVVLELHLLDLLKVHQMPIMCRSSVEIVELLDDQPASNGFGRSLVQPLILDADYLPPEFPLNDFHEGILNLVLQDEVVRVVQTSRSSKILPPAVDVLHLFEPLDSMRWIVDHLRHTKTLKLLLR